MGNLFGAGVVVDDFARSEIQTLKAEQLTQNADAAALQSSDFASAAPKAGDSSKLEVTRTDGTKTEVDMSPYLGGGDGTIHYETRPDDTAWVTTFAGEKDNDAAIVFYATRTEYLSRTGGAWVLRKTDTGATAVTTDPIPTDGSTNPVQSDGVFDALALKENTANKTTTIRAAGTADDTLFPTEKAVRDAIPSVPTIATDAEFDAKTAEKLLDAARLDDSTDLSGVRAVPRSNVVKDYVNTRDPFLGALGWHKSGAKLVELGARRFAVTAGALTRWDAANHNTQSASHAEKSPAAFQYYDRNGLVATGFDASDVSAPQDQIAQGVGWDNNGTLADIAAVSGDTNDGANYFVYMLPASGDVAVLLPQRIETNTTNAFYRLEDQLNQLVLPAALSDAVLLGVLTLDENAGNFTFSLSTGPWGSPAGAASAADRTAALVANATARDALTETQMTENGMVLVLDDDGAGNYAEYRVLSKGATFAGSTVRKTYPAADRVPLPAAPAGGADAATPYLWAQEDVDAWGVSRRVERIFDVEVGAGPFNYPALGYVNKTAVYTRNLDQANGIDYIYRTDNTVKLRLIRADGGIEFDVDGVNSFNVQPGEMVFAEKKSDVLFEASIVPAERVKNFETAAAANGFGPLPHDSIVTTRDGLVGWRRTGTNGVAFPADGQTNADWFVYSVSSVVHHAADGEAVVGRENVSNGFTITLPAVVANQSLSIDNVHYQANAAADAWVPLPSAGGTLERETLTATGNVFTPTVSKWSWLAASGVTADPTVILPSLANYTPSSPIRGQIINTSGRTATIDVGATVVAHGQSTIADGRKVEYYQTGPNTVSLADVGFVNGPVSTFQGLQRIGNQYRPTEIDVQNSTITTGLDMTRATGSLRLQFTDRGDTARPWPAAEIDLEEIRENDGFYVWNHDNAYLECTIDDLATGQFTIVESTRGVNFISAEIVDFADNGYVVPTATTSKARVNLTVNGGADIVAPTQLLEGSGAASVVVDLPAGQMIDATAFEALTLPVGVTAVVRDARAGLIAIEVADGTGGFDLTVPFASAVVATIEPSLSNGGVTDTRGSVPPVSGALSFQSMTVEFGDRRNQPSRFAVETYTIAEILAAPPDSIGWRAIIREVTMPDASVYNLNAYFRQTRSTDNIGFSLQDTHSGQTNTYGEIRRCVANYA